MGVPLLVLYAISRPCFGRKENRNVKLEAVKTSGQAGFLPSRGYLLLDARAHGPELRFSLHLVEDSARRRGKRGEGDTKESGCDAVPAMKLAGATCVLSLTNLRVVERRENMVGWRARHNEEFTASICRYRPFRRSISAIRCYQR